LKDKSIFRRTQCHFLWTHKRKLFF